MLKIKNLMVFYENGLAINNINILENGGAVLEGDSKELIENPDVKSAYFGM